jgi:hypothetical protein
LLFYEVLEINDSIAKDIVAPTLREIVHDLAWLTNGRDARWG